MSPVRQGFRIWENLSLHSVGSYRTIFKIVGVAVVLGAFGLAFKAYRARTTGAPPQAAPSTTSSPRLVSEVPVPLPYGLQEFQVKNLIDYLTRVYKVWSDPKNRVCPDVPDPQKPVLGALELQEMCKSPHEVSGIHGCLLKYAQEKRIIQSYVPLRCGQFQVVLSEEFIKGISS